LEGTWAASVSWSVVTERTETEAADFEMVRLWRWRSDLAADAREFMVD
jgi:hypothetical protein